MITRSLQGMHEFMKLIGDLKKKVENATTKEEVRESIKKAGMLLDDDELEQVSGGVTPSDLQLISMKFTDMMKGGARQRSIKDIEEQTLSEYELQKMVKTLETGTPYEGSGTPTVPSGSR